MYDSDNQYSNFNNFPYDSSAQKTEEPYNTVSDRSYGESAGNGTGAPEEPKKGSGLAKKLGTAAACALVFGAVAGVTMGTVSRAVAPKNSVASAETSAAAEVMPNLTKTATKGQRRAARPVAARALRSMYRLSLKRPCPRSSPSM